MYVEFLEGKKHGAKDADISESHEAFQDAGYLLSSSEVVVDIDCMPREALEKMLQMFHINTQVVWTDRGCHLYFKKPEDFRGANRVCALGIPVEFKHQKNTKAVTIKRGGILREIQNEGVREDLPPIFTFNKRAESLLGLSQGEARNNKLYSHRLKVAYIPDWMNILRYINNYVFAEPLPEDEYQTLVRDLKIEADKDDEPEVAEYLITKYKVVFYGGILYFYVNGEFQSDVHLLRRLVVAEVGQKKIRYIDEVIKQMEYKAPIIPDSKTFDIKFPNGILRDGKFIEIESEEFTPYNIEIPYDPDAEPVEVVDNYINALTSNDPDYRDLLMESLAHSLIVNKEFKRLLAKFFIFVGDGGNGKGTLLTIIRGILGSKNCTGLSISNMADERYFVTMKGKLANLGDDIQDAPINDQQMKQLKNISSCDYVATRELFKQSSETELTITLIFTSNHIIKTFEKGESYRRRVLWMPMYTKPEKKDPLFISKLTTAPALEYWMRLIVEAYLRLYKNHKFTECQLVTDFNSQYHEENNGAILYVSDLELEDLEGKQSVKVYEDFKIWAEENDVSASKKMLREAIYDRFGLKVGVKKINGTSCRVFLRQAETAQKV